MRHAPRYRSNNYIAKDKFGSSAPCELDCSFDIPDIGFQREDLFYCARLLCGTDALAIRRAISKGENGKVWNGE